jgi:hypothetical protein
LAQNSDSQDNKTERLVIEDALANLRVLQRDKLGFPPWKKEYLQAAAGFVNSRLRFGALRGLALNFLRMNFHLVCYLTGIRHF